MRLPGDEYGLRQKRWCAAHLRPFPNPSTAFSGEPSEFKAIPKRSVGIRAGEPEVILVDCREHNPAAIKRFKEVAKFGEGEERKCWRRQSKQRRGWYPLKPISSGVAENVRLPNFRVSTLPKTFRYSPTIQGVGVDRLRRAVGTFRNVIVARWACKLLNWQRLEAGEPSVLALSFRH